MISLTRKLIQPIARRGASFTRKTGTTSQAKRPRHRAKAVGAGLGLMTAAGVAYQIAANDRKRTSVDTFVVGSGMNGCGTVASMCMQNKTKGLVWTSLNETLSSMSGPRNFGLSRCTDAVFARMLDTSLNKARDLENEYRRITGKTIEIVQQKGFLTMAQTGSSLDNEMRLGVAHDEISNLNPEQAAKTYPHLVSKGFNVYDQPQGGIIDVDALTHVAETLAKHRGVPMVRNQKMIGYRRHIPWLENPGYKVTFESTLGEDNQAQSQQTMTANNLVLMMGPNLKKIVRQTTQAKLIEEKLFAIHILFENTAAEQFLKTFPGPALNVQIGKNNALGIDAGIYYFSPVVKLANGSVLLRGGVYHTHERIEVSEAQPEIAQHIDLEAISEKREQDYRVFLNYFIKDAFANIDDNDDIFVQPFFCPISKIETPGGHLVEGIPSHHEQNASGQLIWAVGNGISGKYAPGNGFAVTSALGNNSPQSSDIAHASPEAKHDIAIGTDWLRFGEVAQ